MKIDIWIECTCYADIKEDISKLDVYEKDGQIYVAIHSYCPRCGNNISEIIYRSKK